MKKIKKIALPKWSAMVVKGKSVTEEQAAEIIVRTDSTHFNNNDEEFCKKLNKEYFGYAVEAHQVTDAIMEDKKCRPGDAYEIEEAICEEYGNLSLSYVNNSRIASCWVGGVHGWCDWDGTIGCNNYNIGKYPYCESILEDWKLIAKTFPYLDLRCQLFSGETCEENIKPLIEFVVKSGKVTWNVPTEGIGHPDITDDDIAVMDESKEIGCTIEKFRESLKLCKVKAK